MNSATIVICTFNRCKSLARTLESLCSLDIPPGLHWEVMIIDNNCTDETAATAATFEQRLPVRHLQEPNQGLSWSRSRGVRECDSDLVIFLDDDVVVASSWLAGIISAADAHPEAGYFGSRVLPFWPEGKPRWFRDESLGEFGGLVVHHDLGEKRRRYTGGDLPPIGASMVFRRHLLLGQLPFKVELDPIGNKRGAGGDTEMIRRLQELNIHGVYVPESHCWHATEKARTTIAHAFSLGVVRGRTRVMMEGVPAAGSVVRALSYLLRGLYQLAKGRQDRLRLCIRRAGAEIGAWRELRRRSARQ